MTAPLPDRWEDEPWPLDDPIPAPGLRPTNWSDTHDQPPQVADLADEAQELVDRYGWSMERALVHAQHRHRGGGTFAGLIRAGTVGHSAGRRGHASAVPALRSVIRQAAEEEQLERARQAAAEFGQALARVAEALADVDVDALLEQTLSMAEQARKPKQRICPQHGPMAAGGFCRRCGR